VAKQRGVSSSLTPLKYELLAGVVLEDIIDRYVFLEYSKKDSSVFVENEAVQQQLDGQIKMFLETVGSVDSLEIVFGKPLKKIKADYWDEIYNAMLIEKYKFFLTSGFSVGKKEIELFYDEYKDSLPPSPARGNFSIYNVAFEPSSTTLKESFLFVDSLLDSVLGGFFTFDNIIKKYSDDFSSLSSSGIVGYTERGSLFLEYEEEAFSMKIGDVGGPIKTQAGYHLIKLLDRRGNKINTQHLLKIVSPTEVDRQLTITHINELYDYSKNNPLFLENHIEEKGQDLKNLSGNYNNFPLSNLPGDLYNIIQKSKDSFLYEPFVLKNGTILLLYVYEVFPEAESSLDNSYDFIKSIALDKKTLDYLDQWVFNARDGVYVNIFLK
jgi:peptidyl-prolyl cis-trans isomerase SurA